jgi:hypothetical protein
MEKQMYTLSIASYVIFCLMCLTARSFADPITWVYLAAMIGVTIFVIKTGPELYREVDLKIRRIEETGCRNPARLTGRIARLNLTIILLLILAMIVVPGSIQASDGLLLAYLILFWGAKYFGACDPMPPARKRALAPRVSALAH